MAPRTGSVRFLRRRGEGGAAAVEMALSLFVLMPLVLGMLQYGWYFFAAQSASSAARETARRLVVGDCTASGQAQTYARNQSSMNDLTLTFGTQANPTTNTLPANGEVLRVQVRADGKIIGYLPLPNDGQITQTVDALVEDQTQGAAC